MPRQKIAAVRERRPASRRAAARAGSPPLAKISAPRLVETVARERLFALLDRRLARPVAWISGPPGAGKTTLAAAYATARARPVLWYQVDHGDDDVASFFHYLERALEPHRPKRASALPRFVPEYRSDLAGFTRRFAREAWSRLPPGAILVLDNVQEAASPAFGEMLAALLEEIPEGISAIAVSRAEPPRELAGLLARRRIAALDPEALRFTIREAGKLLAAHGLPRAAIARIQRESEGWAAGLVLMSQGGAASGAGAHRTREALFAYFATQVVEKLPPAWRKFLLLTAVLPRVTAAAGNALARTNEGATILETLYRHHLFIDRREEAEPTYQYHALFREFLSHLAHSMLPAAEIAGAVGEAATVAEGSGWSEDAVRLYLDAGDWGRAAHLLDAVAPALLAQGRAQTVEGWLERLPPTTLDARPSLWFALGQARIQRDEMAARQAFERAHVASAKRGDKREALLAACATLETLFNSYRDWTGANRWIATIRRDFALVDDWPREADRLRAHAGYLLALMVSADRDDREVARAGRVLLPLLSSEALDVNDRLRVAALMVDTCVRSPDRRAIFAKVDAIARPLVEHPASSPLLRARYLANSADEASAEGDHETAQRSIDRARALLEQHGMRHLAFELAYRDLRVAFNRGDLPACDARLEEIDRHTKPGNLPQETARAFLHFHRDILKGDHLSALANARAAIRFAEQAELPSADYHYVLRALALALSANGRYEEAAGAFARVAALSAGFVAQELRVLQELALAAASLGQTPNPHLAKGLERARSLGSRLFFSHVPDLARSLCLAALREGIETAFVSEVIVSRRFRPADPNDGAWPWPLRLRTLGDFALLRGGKPVSSSGKSARRPLDLLKFIVASGRREVSAAKAVATLWPDLEGDQAKSAFNVALHRLRKLLGIDEAVTLEGGRIGLAADHVWVDAFAFEHYATQAEALFAQDRAGEGEAAARTALELYGGDFLRDEEDDAWQLVERSRLCAKYTRLVILAGQHWIRSAQAQKARHAYERALELEPLAEEIYRGLMLVLMGMGQPAEALRVYRRCRDMLSVVLGVKPSAETERVHEALRGG